ncbi:hypothetical protein VTG60DRAFT_2066 [Thermothelomyces hinnuleus]
MKFTLPITTLLLAVAVSVDAAAVADQDKRYCLAEGQACDTVKRAAEAFADAVRDNANLAVRDDETEGEVAWIARRQLHELAIAIAASHDDPAAFYRALGFHGSPTETETETPTEKREAEPWCTQFLGQPCWKKEKREEEEEEEEEEETAGADGVVEARDASPYCVQSAGQPCWNKRADIAPTPVKRAPEPWCTDFLGQPCWKKKKRDAAADPEPWCKQFLGMPCWKRGADNNNNNKEEKREAAPAAEPDRFCSRFTGSSCWKRDGGAAAAEEVKRCTSEGRACWRAKRAAAAVINAIDVGNSVKMARDADPGWCRQFLGMPCWKRAASCNAPAGICTRATRDLHAMYNAARSIIES